MTKYRIILVPFAAIINYHKLGGLKQRKFIIQFWRSVSEMGLAGLKFRGAAGPRSFWRLSTKHTKLKG